MKTRMLEATVLVLVLGLVGYFMLRHDSMTPPSAAGNEFATNSPVQNSSRSVATVSTSATAAVGASAVDLAARAGLLESGPATNSILTLPPQTVLDNARVVIHNYNSAFGENPVGNNAEITAALMGNNPKQITFITAESGLRVNGSGELVDGYGTPFFFHQLSGKEMEIRSAGEDRQMWTLDDQVTR